MSHPCRGAWIAIWITCNKANFYPENPNSLNPFLHLLEQQADTQQKEDNRKDYEKTKVTWWMTEQPASRPNMILDKAETSYFCHPVRAVREVCLRIPYIKITWRSDRCFESLLANTDVQVQRTSSVNVTPWTEWHHAPNLRRLQVPQLTRPHSITVDFSPQAQHVPMNCMWMALPISREYLQEVKPTVTATASESHTKFEGGHKIGYWRSWGCTYKNVSTCSYKFGFQTSPCWLQRSFWSPIQSGPPNAQIFEMVYWRYHDIIWKPIRAIFTTPEG